MPDKLTFDDDFLLDSAQKRYEEGDYFGALTILNKRERRNAPTADAYVLYADIYEALELWPQAADAWYRFMDTCAHEEFYDGYEGLAIAYMNMGNDMQADFYFRMAASENDMPYLPENMPQLQNRLRLVHDADADATPKLMAAGLSLLKEGDLSAARDVFRDIPESNEEFASGAGLSAMCTLMMGEEKEAERECEELVARYPDNVQILTTYCAVLGATDQKEKAADVARQLAALPDRGTDDLYRVATALCETGLHREAFEKLSKLQKLLPFDENVLWFRAVAAYHVQDIDTAIDCLETLTTLRPRKAVALFYLEKLRRLRDDGEPLTMGYFYRLPERDYRDLAASLLQAARLDDEELAQEVATESFRERFGLAFDEMEGHDEKLQLLALKVALRGRADSLVRAVLLDCDLDESVKIAALHELVCRNEEDSFGVVFCNLYREVFLHSLRLEGPKQEEFLNGFADVYTKFALLGEESEERLCNAAEDIYLSLLDDESYELLEERAALAAAIYREARLRHGTRSISEISALFQANEKIVKLILDHVM